MKVRLAGFLLIWVWANSTQSQDTNYARHIVKQLSSKKYYGRGYYKKGAIKSADYIAAAMKKAGLKPLPGQKDFYQHFSFNVNAIDKVSLKMNGKTLRPGNDYIVDAGSQKTFLRIKTGRIINESTLADSAWIFQYQLDVTGKTKPAVIIDTLSASTEKKYKNTLAYVRNHFRLIVLARKLTWTVATEPTALNRIEILRSAVTLHPHYNILDINIQSHFFQTKQKNVLGYVRGATKPDSFLFVSAHYDHLGMMGKKAMFPGANDNACGVAMMLDLAKYYVKNPHKYSIVFVAFAGEEAGLIGSHYLTENPLVPLEKIRFLMNLDLVGTGEDGATVVNASVFKKEFKSLDSLNKLYHLLPKIITRGKAANSDHYFFTEKGVPSFFIYLAGPRPYYHDVLDTEPTLTLAGYLNTFQLIQLFFNAF